MLLAVLEARCGLNFSSAEVYLNVAGGYRLSDPAADLAVIASLVSALSDKPLQANTVWYGEVSLSGDIRTVSNADLRIREAEKLGFKGVFGPKEDNVKTSELRYSSLDKVANLVDLVIGKQ